MEIVFCVIAAGHCAEGFKDKTMRERTRFKRLFGFKSGRYVTPLMYFAFQSSSNSKILVIVTFIYQIKQQILL